ncbi:MAG: metallophosphoesterase [Gemmatimonadota bacterium]
MSLFLATFFLVYGSVHAYALLKAKSALGFGWGTALALLPVLALLAAGPVIVHHLGRHGMEGEARAASWIAYVWMGLLFFLFWMILAVDAANLAARIAGALAGRRVAPVVVGRAPFLALAGLAVALGAYAGFEARDFRVDRVRLASDKLPAAGAPLRIAQISDVHLGLIVRHARARAIADAILRENPDVLVSTGDLVDGEINHLDGLAEIFGEIRPPLGKYAVTGNHEFYAGIGQALAFTRRAGFTVLRGESVTVASGFRIAGVDDPAGAAFGAQAPRTEGAALGEGSFRGFTLFLKHRPSLSRASRGRFELQLSGHTHAGQIFPFRLLVRIWYPLLSGLRALDGGGFLYTSRGTGTWGPPMRLLAPPEVTIFEIEGRAAPAKSPEDGPAGARNDLLPSPDAATNL